MFIYVYTVDFENLLLNYISFGSLEPKSFAGIFLGGKKNIFYENPWCCLKWHGAVEVTWLMNRPTEFFNASTRASVGKELGFLQTSLSI